MKLSIPVFVTAVVIATGAGAIVIATSLSPGDQIKVLNSELRDLTGFTDIVLRGDINLEIEQGAEFLVEVEAPDGALHALHTLVDGTTLEIHLGAGSAKLFGILFTRDYVVAVTLPELQSLTAVAGAEVDGKGIFAGDRLSLIARAGSEIDLEVDVGSMNAELYAGSDIDLVGAAETAMIHASGGSDFSGGTFVARDVVVDLSGGSEASLTVVNRIAGSISGGSDLVYQGSPATVELSAAGGSDVERR